MAARLPDKQTREQMIRDAKNNATPIKDSIKTMLRVNDEQIAVNRYKWFNLPPGLDGQMIERILYYRGSGMFFYVPELNEFHFLPYTLDGGTKSIDFYGRWLSVHPLPFMGTDSDDKSEQAVILSTMKRQPLYDLATGDIKTDLETKCVLLHDYCKQLSQKVIPRRELNEMIIDVESNIIPYVNTLLANSTGVAGMRVNSGDEQMSVQSASDTCQQAALNCKRWVPFEGQIDLQDFSTATAGRAEDMLMAMQSIDNVRLGSYGVDNGGIFEKKAHILNAEAAMNTGTSSLVMDDGLFQRQTFCTICNSLAPLGMWCEVNETAAGADRDMDGMIGGDDPDSEMTNAAVTTPQTQEA